MGSAVHFLIFFINSHHILFAEDPMDIEPHGPPKVNSVFKMLIDIFSDLNAAELFYTNDVRVLIDIIIRWLTDLGPGDKVG